MPNTESHNRFLQHIEYRCALVAKAVYHHEEDGTIQSLSDYTKENLRSETLKRLTDSAYRGNTEGVLAKHGLPDATEEQIDEIFDGDYVSLFKKNAESFQTKLFFDSRSDRFILGFAGTNPLNFAHLESNLRQFFGQSAEHYEWGMDIAQHIAKKYREKVILAGHSLGGGIATVAALAGGLEAYVFNPPCIHKNTLERVDAVQKSHSEKHVHRFVVFGEVLDIVNKTLGLNHHCIGEKTLLYGSFKIPMSSFVSVAALLKRLIPGVGTVLAVGSPLVEKSVQLHSLDEVLYGLRRHLS